ncbi:MAG TPA: adenylate/guanylate cyclase domain-containing protein [Acidimicrobiales bacterium]|nr:adenylate/guanylate cyclase domain-containing protein [Acidimicrobiales bacterium]
MRVRRTFAFLDLSGFSALTESEGDERAVAVLGVFRSALRDICSRRAVRIAKWLGDGAMLVSVDTMPLVAATLEMKAAIEIAPEPVTIKCGVTSGTVILLEGDDYIGHAVNVAARLCDLAVGREVLAVPSVVAELPPWATVESTTEMSVRGLEQPIDVVRLGLPRPGPDTQPDPVCRIALTHATAVARRHEADGRELLFCAESCAEMWDQRRRGSSEIEAGSIREVWMR